MRGLRWIQAYYLASPVFFLIGLWWGFEIRVTFLPDPGKRFFYYVFLSGLGLLSHFKPRAAPWVALLESSVNLLLIFLWILLPIYSMAEAAGDAGPLGLPYTPTELLVNGLLAGGFFGLGFYRAQGILARRLPRTSSRGF